MPAAKKPGKAAAATDEVAAQPAPKTLDWNNVTLNLPDEMPGEVVWLIPTMEENGLSGIIEVFQIVLGADQVATVRSTLAGQNLGLNATVEALGNLFEQISDLYGLTAGN